MDYNKIISNVKVYGLEDSIKRAKYPMSTDINKLNNSLTDGIKKLWNTKCGTGHDQALTGVIVQFDLTFTIKAWTEAERYHFLDFVSSQSTMHRIARFDLDNSYNEYVDGRITAIMKEKIEEYNKILEPESNEAKTILNEYGLEKLSELKKNLYLEILYSNPCGFKLTAGMTTNYRQLKTIYFQRRNHRLPEWRAFCKWVETLPMFKELCLGGNIDEGSFNN